MLIGYVLAIVGYIMLIAGSRPSVKYGGTFAIACGGMQPHPFFLHSPLQKRSLRANEPCSSLPELCDGHWLAGEQSGSVFAIRKAFDYC
jgi:hypothetical protein